MPRSTTLASVFAFILMTSCSHRSSAQSTEVSEPATTQITLHKLEDMFANMRANTKWDVDAELLWGYFFTDPDPKKLEQLVVPLTRKGYRFVSIYETDNKSTHFLHVERVEKHSPKTLHARNTEFYKLAEQFNLESYDGMDVGPVHMK